MSGLSPENVNPRFRRTPFRLPVVLTVLLLILFLVSTPILQTTGGPDSEDVEEAGHRVNQQQPDTEDPPATVGGAPDDARKTLNDESFLKEKRAEINRLLKQRRFSEAQDRAHRVRKTLKDVDEEDLTEKSVDLYNNVLSRVKEAYKDVRDKADRYNDAGQPYRAYKYVRKEAKNFKGTAPWHRRLQRFLRTVKPAVVEAYRNGRLDERPDFFLDSEQHTSGQDESEDSERRSSSSTTTPDETATETGASGKPSANPRINASSPTMSNAPGSPKAFSAHVVQTTENGVHFEVDFHGANSRQKMGYFLFELRGLKGRENVRIDLTNMGRWGNSKTITPMYSYGIRDLSELTMLQAKPPTNGRIEHVETAHGQIVPQTNGLQKWHYFRNVTVDENKQTLTIRKRFPNEMTHTYIAHRVPYPYSYHKNFMEKLKERARYGAEGLTVHEVGTSRNGRPLHIVELENPTDPEATNKPVVVFTSGEHPDEHATYQAMNGTIRHLLRDDPGARALRRRATFLFVPVLDPDGLVRNMYEHICYTFIGDSRFLPEGPSHPSRTARAYARWFRKWANDGRRLDVHLLTHCVESGETNAHLFNYLVEPASGRRQTNLDLWRTVRQTIRNAGYRVDDEPSGEGYTTNRLGGFLEKNFRTLQLFVELNSQPRDPGRNLTLYEQRELGVKMIRSTVQFLYSEEADPLYRSIKRKRTKRRQLVNRYEPFLQSFDQARHPFERESWLKSLPAYERTYLNWKKKRDRVSWVPQCKRWFEQLYEQHDVSPNTVPQ